MEPMTDDEIDLLAGMSVVGASDNLTSRAAEELLSLRAELAASEARGFAVAAEACVVSGGLAQSAGGGTYCTLRERVSELEKQLAAVTAERGKLLDWKESAKIVMNTTHTAWERCGKPGKLGQSIADAMADEVIRLRAERDELHAELMQTPPTLEWLRKRFGEPSKRHGTVTEWGSYESPFWIMHQIGGHVSVCVQGQNVMVPKETRAAVLAAVANTSTGEDNTNG